MANKDRAYGFVAKGPLLRANPHAVDASNSTAVFVGDLTSMEDDGFCTPASAGDIVILGSALSSVAVSTATTSANPPIQTTSEALPTMSPARARQ